jgi:hypothetical protein
MADRELIEQLHGLLLEPEDDDEGPRPIALVDLSRFHDAPSESRPQG